jgi:energy-converting hydrogenase Eha subunit C
MSTQIPTPVLDKAPYVASGGVGLATLTLSDWYMIVGIVTCLLTWVFTILLNWYYKRREDERRQAEHERVMDGSLEHREFGYERD